MHHSDGRVQQVPPIDDRFELDQVLLRTDAVPPEIHILFRWAGEQVLFGVREAVVQDDDDLQFLGGAGSDGRRWLPGGSSASLDSRCALGRYQ